MRVELLVTVDKIVSSNLQPVNGGSVLVKLRSTGSPVTVYAGETGGTTISNPLTTDAQGRVNGWVEEGSLVLTISGSGITTYNQPYEATRADSLVLIDGARVAASTMPGSAIANSSIPSTKLANGAVLGKHLAESAMPLGTILAWWQPSKPGGGYTIPTGFALANGQTLLAPSGHDFPGGGSVVLPNLISKVPIGADPAAAYNATGAVVGMNGVAGANVLDLHHQHPMPHTHNIAAHSHTVANHVHSIAHTHTVFIADHTHSIPYTKFNTGSSTVAVRLNGGATGGSSNGGYNAGTSGSSAANSGGAAPATASQTGGTVTGAVNTANTSDALSATQDIRQASQGVLYIVKVKNTV